MPESLFENDPDKSVLQKFQNAVGHYLNFVNRNVLSNGFAQSNDSAIYGSVVIWHGSSTNKTSWTPDTFDQSLHAYIQKVGAQKVQVPDNLQAIFKASDNLGNAMRKDSSPLCRYVRLQHQLQALRD